MKPKLQGTISRTPFYNTIRSLIHSFNHSLTNPWVSAQRQDLWCSGYFHTEIMTFADRKILGFVPKPWLLQLLTGSSHASHYYYYSYFRDEKTKAQSQWMCMKILCKIMIYILLPQESWELFLLVVLYNILY